MTHTKKTARTVVAVSLPALVGGALGAIVALVIPQGNQGDLFASPQPTRA